MSWTIADTHRTLIPIQGAKAGPFGACLAFTQKASTPNDPTPGNPPPSDVDYFSEALDVLKQKAQNEPVTIMPIAKKVVPVNLSMDKRRRSLESNRVSLPPSYIPLIDVLATK